MTRKTRGASTLSVVVATSLLMACGADGTEDDGQHQDLLDPFTAQEPAVLESPDLDQAAGFRIPVDFQTGCEYLRALPEAPATLTMAQFLNCLTPESHAALSKGYTRRFGVNPSNPATLADYSAQFGDRLVSEGRIGVELIHPADAEPNTGSGVAEPTLNLPEIPDLDFGVAGAPTYGLDPATCSRSCMTYKVGVVGATRTIGYSPAWRSGGSNPNDSEPKSNANWWRDARWLDLVEYGKFSDLAQDDLSNADLRAAGCGPVSAVNMYEWWNMPIYNGATRLTTFNSRATYFANNMDTLSGIDFTDDGDLFSVMKGYPKKLYDAGRISGYPGYHYGTDDANEFKAILGYVARGFPVIALYSTGSESLHWALLTGYGYLYCDSCCGSFCCQRRSGGSWFLAR